VENVNQLRTMWFNSPQRRLASWREFRKSLDTSNFDDTCEQIFNWWSFAPLSALSIDPYDVRTWPSVWEMLHRGDYCKFSTAIGMSYTFFYIDEKLKNNILRVYDHENSDIYMTALIQDKWLLNYNKSSIAKWSEVQDNITVQESWTCKDIVETTKHYEAV